MLNQVETQSLPYAELERMLNDIQALSRLWHGIPLAKLGPVVTKLAVVTAHAAGSLVWRPSAAISAAQASFLGVVRSPNPTLVLTCAEHRPGGVLPLAVAAVGAGVGLASGAGLLPAQGALSTAPYSHRLGPVPATALLLRLALSFMLVNPNPGDPRPSGPGGAHGRWRRWWRRRHSVRHSAVCVCWRAGGQRLPTPSAPA